MPLDNMYILYNEILFFIVLFTTDYSFMDIMKTVKHSTIWESEIVVYNLFFWESLTTLYRTYHTIIKNVSNTIFIKKYFTNFIRNCP